MYGGDGADLFVDNDGNSDTMYGGAGNDSFDASDGATDYLDGGADTDTIVDMDTNPYDTTVNI